MREIKFRAWDKEKKKMYADVGIFPFPWNERTRNSSWSFSADGTTVNPYHENITLMQYTGLKDKNGKEVYEGDILEAKVYVPGQENSPTFWPRIDRWEVKLEKEEFDNGWKYIIWNVSVEDKPDYEIIGNIHENPELLGEK